MNPANFRALVSGERRGLGPTLMRGVLRMGETPYRLAVGWRNRGFDRGRRPITCVNVPVISVGNLTVGGTGKTPLVEWIARWLRDQLDKRVTLVSRGYGAEAGSRNDEALELEHKLPDVPHLQNPDRVAAANMAIEEFECEVVLLDDAFQHRRIHRDLDIVLLDALEPFGHGHLLPRGLLREPVSGLSRADVVLLSRADLVAPAERERIRAVVQKHAPHADWVEARHAPRELLASSGRRQDLATIRGCRVAAFCGIGNPAGFRRTDEGLGCQLVGFREFPDHHAYERTDVESLAAWVSEIRAEIAICTHKDLVKLGVPQLGRVPLWALAIGLGILAGQEALERHLRELFPPADAQ